MTSISLINNLLIYTLRRFFLCILFSKITSMYYEVLYSSSSVCSPFCLSSISNEQQRNSLLLVGDRQDQLVLVERGIVVLGVVVQ